MFILMIIGFTARAGKLIDGTGAAKLNRLVFIVCYPCMMFHNLYGADLEEALNPKLICFAVISVFAVIGLSIPLIHHMEKESRRRGVMVQAIYRSNFVIMGLPVAMNIYGAGNVAVTAMLIAIIVPIYNVMAVVVLETYRKGEIKPGHILVSVLKNPLILGAIAGLTFVVTGWKLPAFAESVVDELSTCAITMSLISLGASFSMGSISRTKKDMIFCVLGRLIIVPGIFLPVAALLGFRGVTFVSLVAMYAAPTAIASFTMAQVMDGDGELAGNCVIFSSAFACLSMFGWLFIFKNLGIF